MGSGGLGHVLRSLRDSARFWRAILYLLRKSSSSRCRPLGNSCRGVPRRGPGPDAYPLARHLVAGQRRSAVDWRRRDDAFWRHVFPLASRAIGPDAWPLGPGWGLDSFLSGGFFSLGIFLGLFGLLHLALAWGLFERQSWARFLGLVLGILALLRFPLGTALGIYTLCVLAPEPSAREYDQLSRSGRQIDGAGFSATPR